MDFEMVTLRLIHIVFGVLWAGSATFFAFILQPRLQKLGPTIMGPVMGAIAPITAKVLLTSAGITIAAGVTLALRLRWGNLDTFLSTGWGWAILIGFLASIGALSTGISTAVLSKRMISLGSEIAGRAPTPEEGAEMQRLAVRLPRMSRATAVMTLIAVGTMASARFV